MIPKSFNWLAGRGDRRRRAFVPEAAAAIERLEQRVVLDVTLASIAGATMSSGKDLFIPLTPTDDGTDPLDYTVQTSDVNVTAEVLTGNRSLAFTINIPDGNGSFTQEVLTFYLFEDIAPETTARIIELVNLNAYDDNPSTLEADSIFHRIIDDFVAQAGDFENQNGTGGSGVEFDDEFDSSVTFSSGGLLAMANAGDDTNDSQFFIVDTDLTLAEMPEHLNFNHTIFGVLTSGFDAFTQIMAAQTDSSDKPLEDIEIVSVDVFTDTRNSVVRISAPVGFTGTVDLTATATNSNDLGDTDSQDFSVTVQNDPLNDRAFLEDATVSDLVTNEDQAITFQVAAIDLEEDDLTYVVRSGTDFNAVAPNVIVDIVVTPAANGVPSFATITLTPADDFVGTLDLQIGVRDGVNRVSGGTIDSEGNFDTQNFTLTVNAVEDPPDAPSQTVTIAADETFGGILPGSDGDPELVQAITFAITRQPDNGVITNFDSTTGFYDYTPNAGFTGTDSFNYTVTEDDTQIVSDVGTITLTVFATTPDVPTALDLAPGSDDGFFSDDNFTSVSNPTFTVSAEPGSLVRFTLNDAVSVFATETSDGVFQVTLAPGQMRVGENVVDVAASTDGIEFSDPETMTFTYAPSYESVYTVPGVPGTNEVIVFDWTSRQASYDNELGYFFVDDSNGTVNGIAPGGAGYTAAALARATVVFGSGAGEGASMSATLPAGTLLAFYLVSDGSTGEALAGSKDVFFSLEAANSDGVDHSRSVGDASNGAVLYHWEDKAGGGDRDYNDVVFTTRPATSGAGDVAAALRVPAGAGVLLTTTFRLDRFPGIDGEFGLFVADDAAGRINGLSPGDSGYAAAALASSTAIFGPGDVLGSMRQLALEGGAHIGFYFVAGGTADSLLASNPTNVPGGGPIAFFSFDSANPDGVEHFRWFNPEFDSTESDGLLLHGMTDLGGGDADFDDLLVGISFG